INHGKKRALRINLVGEVPELKQAAKQALARVTEPPLQIVESDAAEQGASDSADPHILADVSMVIFSGNDEQAFSLVTREASREPRPIVFALLKDRSPVLMKHAIRAGADELLFMPLDTGEVTSALLKISEARMRAGRGKGGTVISIASIVGGVGVTALAANLA